MDKLEQIDEINKEIRSEQDKEMYYKRHLRRHEARADYQKRRNSPEYKARTRRLIDKGGTMEHFYPETKDMTAGEFYELIEFLNMNNTVRSKVLSEISRIYRKREGGF